MANNVNVSSSGTSSTSTSSPNPVDKWYFTKEQLDSTPSRKNGYDALKELSHRQQTANFIQDMGQRLKVSQLCINTAIVYMHRFYVFHSFSNFPWHQMAAAALFLAAKVEEQPRKLEYVIRVANMCRNTRDVNIDVNSERYMAQSQDLVFNENVLLQTLGFDVAIDHPHTHVVRCCQLVRASKDLAQTSYFLASNSLHLTTMCLQYKPTVVACFCIHLASKWSNWEIPLSTERKEWFLYVDSTVTAELLQQLTAEFLNIFESCPSRLKEKIMSIGDNSAHNASSCPVSLTKSPFDTEPRKVSSSDLKDTQAHKSHDSKISSENELHKHRSSRPHDASVPSQQQREYREKKLAQQQQQQQQQHHPSKGHLLKQPSSGQHHRPSADPLRLKQQHVRPTSSGSGSRPPEPRDILREAATRDSPFGIATKDNSNNSSSSSNNNNSSNSKQQRDYSLLKPNAAADTNSFGYNGENKNRPLPNKVPMKHEQVRKHESGQSKLPNDMTHQQQQQQAHHGAPKSVPSKSGGSSSSSSHHHHHHHHVPPQQVHNQAVASVAGGKHHHSSSNNGSYGYPPAVLPKEENTLASSKDDGMPLVQQQQQQQSHSVKHEQVPSTITPNSNVINKKSNSSRNYSNGGEPELRPVLKKIDQVEGFENLLRESTIGITKLHKIPDIITPISEGKSDQQEPEPALSYSKEMRPPDLIPPLRSDNSLPHHGQGGLVNGIETNPTLISSLLKEAPPVPHLAAAGNKQPAPESALQDARDGKEQHHSKSKKKNKEKHKHKDKGKSRDEKKKKHKDKDKEKHKHREKEVKHEGAEPSPSPPMPLKMKIVGDKIQPVTAPVRLKISKDGIKTDNFAAAQMTAAEPPAPASEGIKIRIPRNVMANCPPDTGRKRERDRSLPTGGTCPPPGKVSRSSHHHSSKETKQNGRHSASYNNKVTQLGDGD